MTRRRTSQSGLTRPRLKEAGFANLGRLRPGLLFCLKFGLLIVAFYAVQGFGHGGAVYAAYLEFNAWLCHALLDLLGESTRAVHTTVSSAAFSMQIKPGCDALEPAWIFTAAILAWAGPVWPRFLGILAGLAVILALNIVRLVTLFLAGRYCPGLFEPLHLELWPVALILAAVLLFRSWLRSTRYVHAL